MGATNMHTPFDTLAYTKKLKNAGVPENVAEIQAEALAEVICDKLATKQDLQHGLKELELRLTYKLILSLGSIVAACTAILSIIIKLH